jgi:hypothetical protein
VHLAMFEPSFERLHLSSAGQPPPVLALPHQPASLLDVPSDHPVEVAGGLRRRATAVTLPPGALLCFYTDGLIERRDISLDAAPRRRVRQHPQCNGACHYRKPSMPPGDRGTNEGLGSTTPGWPYRYRGAANDLHVSISRSRAIDHSSPRFKNPCPGSFVARK